MTEEQVIQHIKNPLWLKLKDWSIRKKLIEWVRDETEISHYQFNGCWDRANMMHRRLANYFINLGKISNLQECLVTKAK